MSKRRRTYVYVVALLSGLALLFSAVVLADWAVSQWVQGDLLSLTPDALARAPLTPWLWIGAIALVTWLIHATIAARTAHQETAAGLEDRHSSQRKAYLYLMQLAALIVCLVEGGRLVSDLLARFLRQPIAEPGLWTTTTAGAGVGLGIGFAAWAFFRRATLRDGDYGQEVGRAAGWRHFYFYCAIGLGVGLTALGAVQLPRVLLNLGGELVLGRLPSAAASRATVVAALTEMALGMPLAVLAWHGANQTVALKPQRETNAVSRILLLRASAFVATSATLLSLTYVLWQLLTVFFGRRMGEDYALQDSRLTTAVAILPVSVALWLASAGALQSDAALGVESRNAAVIRRIHFYIISAACLAGFWYGATQLLRAVLPLALEAFSALDVSVPISAWRLSLAAALLLVAAPAWWGHWWPLQVRANRFTPAGFEERASVLRQGYLYVVIFIAAALIIVALGLLVFTLVGGRLADATRSATVLISGALALGLVALGWWVLHVLTLRSDRQAQLTWIRVQPSLPQPFTIPVVPIGVRNFSREELAPVAAKVQEPLPIMPAGPIIVVVDGGDGAIGAGVIEALRAALPDIVISPYGLTEAARVAMAGEVAGAVFPGALAHAAVIIAPSDDLVAPAAGVSQDHELQTAVAAGHARVLLLPPRQPQYRWVGAPDWPPERWIQYVVGEAARALRVGG